MVLGVVGSHSQKCPIVFVGAGERVNAVVYQDLPLFLRRLEAVVAKNGGYIEYMGPQQIKTQQSALVRADKSFNKR
jgi:hypothetical protein